MSEFKVGDALVYLSPKKTKRIFYVLKVHKNQNWVLVGNMALKQKFKQLKSMFRRANEEESKAGCRIGCEILDKPENHISPNCKAKDV